VISFNIFNIFSTPKSWLKNIQALFSKLAIKRSEMAPIKKFLIEHGGLLLQSFLGSNITNGHTHQISKVVDEKKAKYMKMQQEARKAIGDHFVPKVALQFDGIDFFDFLVYEKKLEPMKKQEESLVFEKKFEPMKKQDVKSFAKKNGALKLAPQFDGLDPFETFIIGLG